MQNLYVTNFAAPDAHFDYSGLYSDAQVENVGNPKKKTVKEPSDENQTVPRNRVKSVQ
jgi:hypothetical protein